MKLIYRILLTPLVFAYALFLLAAGTLFPITLIVLMSFISVILHPFVMLFRYAGADIDDAMTDEVFFDEVQEVCGTWIAHFVGATIHIWGAFYISWLWVVKGEFFKVD